MWPFSKTFPTVEAAEKEASDIESRITKLRGELANINNQARALVDSGTLESGVSAVRQRARLKAQYEQVEIGVAGLERQLTETKRRRQQILENIERLGQQREPLLRRISEAQTDGEYEKAATELAELLYRLAAYTGDQNFIAKAQEALAGIDERTGCVTLQENWTYQGGRLIREAELIGFGVHAYSAGARILRSEAVRLGMLDSVSLKAIP